VSVTVQPNGDQLIYQNGNLLATVYKNAIDIAYNNTVSGLTATNTQAAIDQLASLIASGAFTVSDTASIDLTKSLTGNISANVIISPDSCNQLQSLANGLYVAPNTVFETSTANWATDLANIP
jgi:hypothetical protein